MVRSIGLDVHRDFCEVAIAEAGAARAAGRILTTPAALELFAQSLAPSDAVAVEATANAAGDRADHRAARRAGRARQSQGGAREVASGKDRQGRIPRRWRGCW